MQRFVLELLAVGVVVTIIGSVSSKAFSGNSSLPQVCKDWNRNYAMEKSLSSPGSSHT